MQEKDIDNLLAKYHAGQCTSEELLFLKDWYNHLEQNLPDIAKLQDLDHRKETVWANVDAVPIGIKPKSKKLYSYWVVAAAIILLFATSYLYFIYGRPDKHLDLYSYNKAHDIPAGTNKAVLTLADGQKIELDSSKAGTVANQNGVQITKNSKGQIVYTVPPLSPQGDPGLRRDDGNGGAKAGAVQYNTITTPNGGQYQVILPDGSHVYLNAASSLKYPIAFNGSERKVELSGEGYFQVTKNPKKPFIVLSSNQSIKVLGTQFNVSAYAGESPKTTLAEGSVLVFLSDPHHPELISGSPSKTLKPGDQSTATANGLALSKVNPADIIAWKDGLFVFTNIDLKDMLRQIARWYDVEVDYASLPAVSYDGEIPRNVSLLKVLKLIEAGSNVSLKLEGRRLMLK